MTITRSQVGGRVASAGEVSQLVEHLFRHEAGQLVSTLTRIFGIERLNRAEDVVQEALARALQTWPYYGVPRNPAAWITQVSKNLALDLLRRERIFRSKEMEIACAVAQEAANRAGEDALFSEAELKDDRLRMMFVCCHPLLPKEAQTALALKTLCGFSTSEIARAFLTSETAILKRLTRAKHKIREARIPFEIPVGEELSARLDGVLHTLYLLFNEGYKASDGEHLIREELCREAIRLGALLAGHPKGNQPRTHALLALMLLNTARLATRVDGDGHILRLQEQDRSRWDQAMIARGMWHLVRSASGDDVSAYHLQAAIAACHCATKDYASTDWAYILSLYDRLAEIDDSPVIALNRAVAVANVHGTAAGLAAVDAIQPRGPLNGYYLLYAVLGEFAVQLNDPHAACASFREALRRTGIMSERGFLSRRIRECEAQMRRRCLQS